MGEKLQTTVKSCSWQTVLCFAFPLQKRTNTLKKIKFRSRKRGRDKISIKMKYFSTTSFYIRTYTALTRSWGTQPGDCFGIFALKDQKVGQLLTRLTWKLFCLPCRHFHNLSTSLIFRSLCNLECSLSFVRTTSNTIHFIGLGFHFCTCDLVIVYKSRFCKAWTPLRDGLIW